MELQFHKTPLTGLRLSKRLTRELEQTQELKVPDDFPQVSRILGVWGQPLLRGKQLQAGSVQISGGVLAWVLYMAEDGADVRSMQTWVPFQARWDLPDTADNGTVAVSCALRSADARSTGARRLMVRVQISLAAELWQPVEDAAFAPQDLPADVCLLRKSYRVSLVREAGEKAFSLEEELTLPATAPRFVSLLYYRMIPQILEKKIMTDKAVFRGTAQLHMLYCAEDGRLCTWDQSFPFSQYAELEQEYLPGTAARILPAVTSLEVEPDLEGRLQVRAGLTGQYMISEPVELELVEDAYSPLREVTPVTQTLSLPRVEGERQQPVTTEGNVHAEGTAVDLIFLPDIPGTQPDGEGCLGLSGQFQLLSRDESGMLEAAVDRWEGTWQMDPVPNTMAAPSLTPVGQAQAALQGDSMMLSSELQLEAWILEDRGVPMVTALQMGEAVEPDPNRPSLILRRAENNSLWQLAKLCNSTVEAITEANCLTAEPEPEQMLLIPVQ